MKREKYLIILFFLIQNIIHNLGHPVTPEFVRSLGIQDYMFGVFFAMMSLGLVIGGPIWGTFGDRGRKKLYIIIGLVLYSIGQFGFGYSNNQYLMVFFRLLSGFGVVAAITLLTSSLIEMTDVSERARYLALIGAAVTLGASLGYFLGGFIAKNPFTVELFNITNYREIFLIQAVLNLLYIGFVFLMFTDRKCDMPTNHRKSVFASFKSIGQIDYRLLLFLISLVFISIGQINLDKYLDVYFIDLSYTSYDIGKFKMVVGIVSLIASIFLVPLFNKVRKQIGLMIIFQLVAASIVFYTFRASNFLLAAYTVFMVYVLTKAVFTPLEQNYISLHAKEGEYGKIMGIRQSFISLGFVIGPIIGGIVYEINHIWIFNMTVISFLIGFVILLIVGTLLKRDIKTSK